MLPFRDPWLTAAPKARIKLARAEWNDTGGETPLDAPEEDEDEKQERRREAEFLRQRNFIDARDTGRGA